jgi:tRNA (guanosine-2'-O-)-methyltransferase
MQYTTMRPRRFHRLREVLSRRQPDLTVLMDHVHKSHNFSAILRNCDAVGVLEAHVVPPLRDFDLHFTSSAGTKKWIRVHRHEDVASAIGTLRATGLRIVAANLTDTATDYREIDFTLPTALVMGAERFGVSEEALSLADEEVTIPMMGMVHSLNVSVATALLLFEAQRQREAAGMYAASSLDPELFRDLLFEWTYPSIAAMMRRRGQPYPPLGEDGEILEPVG